MAFYRIKEAADRIGVATHVLRFWEKQFPQVKPQKTNRGQRLYSEDDISNFLKVKNLLYTEGYSIQGAKKVLKEGKEVAQESSLRAINRKQCQELLEELKLFRVSANSL